MGSHTVEYLESLRDELNDAIKGGRRSGVDYLSDAALADIQQRVPRDRGYQPWWLKMILWPILLLGGWLLGRGAVGVMLDLMIEFGLIDHWSPGPAHHVTGMLLFAAAWGKLISIRADEERQEKELLREIKKLAPMAMKLPGSSDQSPPLSHTKR